MSFKNQLTSDKTLCFSRAKPEDITDEQWELAKAHAADTAIRLPKEQEQSAFYFYYIGDTFEDISSKLSLPLEVVLYTAIYFEWDKRKEMSTSVRAGSKVTRADAAAIDLITDSIVATAAIYKSKLAEAIKDPKMAASCPLIPRNFKELQTLLMMLQSLQTDKVETGKAGPAPVNINIANLTGPQNGNNGVRAIEAEEADPLLIEAEGQKTEYLTPTEKIDILKLLEKAKRT
jgi:hypothetical protein